MKYLFSLSCILAALLIFAFTDEESNAVSAYSSGAPAGMTGSPGDVTNCTACHSGTATSSSGLITSTIPVTGYIPGTTYTITATIAEPSVKFGFEISAQNTIGSKKGTLVVTNSTETQLVGTGGKYITHKLAGTPGISQSRTWTFNWIAPTAGTGSVTFYGAFNATNNNNLSSGDRIILTQMLVNENTLTAVHEPLASGSVSVFPNPASTSLSISPASGHTIELMTIYDLSGKKVMEQQAESGGATLLNIESLQAGVYILTMNMEQQVVTQKIVIQ